MPTSGGVEVSWEAIAHILRDRDTGRKKIRAMGRQASHFEWTRFIQFQEIGSQTTKSRIDLNQTFLDRTSNRFDQT